MNDAEAIWVYAVTKGGTLVAGGPLVGIGGEPVRLVSAGDLTAVTSQVDLAEFGEEPLRRNMEHLPWLEVVARSHHDVVSAVAKMTAVVPMRLATVYKTDQGLARMLGERQKDFLTVLAHIAGRSEWGVKAYVVAPADAERTRADPSAGAPGTTGSGTAYLMKRRAQLTAAEDARQAAVASAQRVHEVLAEHAAAAVLHRPQDPQLSGTTAPMIMNATYLVDDRDRAGFAVTVKSAASASPALRLELTGPWPPYSFAAAEPGTGPTGAGASR